MAKTDTSGKLLLYEPNPAENALIPNEDISIIVNLETTVKGRSILVIDNVSGESKVKTTGGKSETIKFFDGSKYGDGRSLTTNYTEANTSFSPNGDKDLESLGIESIDIDFDTGYAPRVKIKFIDVRGQAVVQQNINSKYRMFFELPYPIFALTVKGYYGKPVKYCLHMVKWNAAFNSKTGNFEIDAEFIGYTYALLTDLLIGIIRAIPYTELGEKEFNKIKEEYGKANIDILTIDEFMQASDKLNDLVNKIKEDSDEIKDLNSTVKILEGIDTLENEIDELVDKIYGDGDYFATRNGIVAVTPSVAKTKKVKNGVSEYKKKVEKFLDTEETGLNETLPKKFKIDTKKLTNIITVSELEKKNLSTTYLAMMSSPKGYKTDDKSGALKRLFDELDKRLENVPEDALFATFDLSAGFKELNRVKELVKENEKVLKETISEQLKQKASEEFGLEPTIRNIIRMFTVHCEAFLNTLGQVSRDAEGSGVRKEVLNTLLINDELNVKKKSEDIYPWPEYKKKSKKDGAYEETWLGKGLKKGDATKVDEIKFVEDILRALMTLAKRDNIALLGAAGLSGPQFFPIASIDAGAGQISKNLFNNPYHDALAGTSATGVPSEAIRCMLMRGFLGLGISNTNIEPVTARAMGQLEAENLYTALLGFKKQTAGKIIDGINSINGSDGTKKKDTTIKKWKIGDSSIKNPLGDNKAQPLLGDYIINSEQDIYFWQDYETGTEAYEYLYIKQPASTKSIDSHRAYIPVDVSFNGTEFYNSDGTLKSTSEIRGVSEKIDFVSSVNNGAATSGITYDGAMCIEFIDEDEYENGANKKEPAYGNKPLEEFWKKIPNGSLIQQNSLKDAVYNKNETPWAKNLEPYGNSRYKAQEFFYINYNGSGEVSNLVYDSGEDKIASTLCAFYYQADWSLADNRIGGTYLSRKRKKEEEKDINWMNIDSDNNYFSPIGAEYPSDGTEVGDLERDKNGAITLGSICRLKSRYTDFGKQREILGNLLDESTDDTLLEDINVPFIEFSIGSGGFYFSLFGSRFYDIQEKKEAKALLFLHSFGWQGIIGDGNDKFNEPVDVSLFDRYNAKDESFYDDDETYTVKSLLMSNGGFVKAPKLWCAWVGSMIYRYDVWKNSGGVNGGIDIIKFQDGTTPVLPGHESVTQTTLSPNQYLKRGWDTNNVSRFGMSFYTESDNADEYNQFDKTLKNLSPSVRETFKNEFEAFVLGFEWEKIRNALELKPSTTWEQSWDDLNNKVVKVPVSPTTDSSSYPGISDKLVGVTDNVPGLKVSDVKNILGDSAIKNYVNISPSSDYHWGRGSTLLGTFSDWGKAYQFNLELRPGTEVQTILKKIISESIIINNININNFRYNNGKENAHKRILVNKERYDTYVESFFNHFDGISEKFSKDKENEDDALQKQLFNTIDDDTIKLQIYRTLSSIYNKWLGGTDIDKGVFAQCGTSQYDTLLAKNEREAAPRLIDSFRFVDRAFNDIGNDLYINPIGITNMVRGKYNQSFFDVVNRILSDNNFNFIPLPTFINFNKTDHLVDMFKPYSYSDVIQPSKDNKTSINNYASGPAFVCVYVGQTSTNLDLGEDSLYQDDGIVIRTDSNFKIIGGVPEDFSAIDDKNFNGSMHVPMFMVNYGTQNQSYFKDIKLDQREFVETAESLQIIEDISNSGDKREGTSVGQNLFNVYQTRSYSAEVEMMGNAMVQPMMYFQLNDIPMFRGAYLIIKVTHSIKAHNMSTKFKGVRVKKTKTPLIDSNVLFMNILGSLEASGESSQIGNFISGDGGVYKEFIDTPLDVRMLPIPKSGTVSRDSNKKPQGVVAQPSDKPLQIYAIREVVEAIQQIGQNFYNEQHSTTSGDTIYYNDLSKMGGGSISGHKTHKLGKTIDFRPIRKDKLQATTTWNGDTNTGYSREGTKKLIQKLLNYKYPVYIQENGNPTKQLTAVKEILFNDPTLLNDSELSRMSKADGHDNHLHIVFNDPPRVTTDLEVGKNSNVEYPESTRKYKS